VARSGTPTSADSRITASAVRSDSRAPMTMRDSTSRPTMSVPAQCCQLGANSLWSNFTTVPASSG